MPTGNAIDYKWYQYVDDSSRNWAVRVNKTWGDDADSGLAAFDSDDPVLQVNGARNRPRKVEVIDALTGRTKQLVVGTQAAMTAIDGTFTQTFAEPGLAGPVTYVFSRKIPERMAYARPIINKAEPSTA